MNFTQILGTLIESGMAPSGKKRLKHALGKGGSSTSGLENVLGGLGSMISGSSGGMDDILGNILGGSKGGGSSKLAAGGLGALAGALLGGGKGAAKGAVGGGTLAMLASLALSALSRRSAATKPQVPPGLLDPQTPEQQQELENDAELIIKAMITAAKADGRIDANEMKNIIGRLDDDGLSRDEKDFLVAEAEQPMNMEKIVSGATGRPDLGLQVYSASMLAIEVDTEAERRYMAKLANGLNLDGETVAFLEKKVGIA